MNVSENFVATIWEKINEKKIQRTSLKIQFTEKLLLWTVLNAIFKNIKCNKQNFLASSPCSIHLNAFDSFVSLCKIILIKASGGVTTLYRTLYGINEMNINKIEAGNISGQRKNYRLKMAAVENPN